MLDKEYQNVRKSGRLEKEGSELSFAMQNEIKLKLKAAAYWRGGVNWSDLFSKYDGAGHGELNYTEFHDAIREGANVSASMLSDHGLKSLFALMDVDSAKP